MSNCDTTDSYTTSLSSPNYQSLQSKGITLPWYLVFGVLLVAFILVGCGPENSGTNQTDLTATTQQIALDYQANQNLDQATAALEALDVANLNQWLLITTESAITSNDTTHADALVGLLNDLGLHSNAIQAYALQHNLLDAAVALEPQVIATTPPPAASTPEVAVSIPPTNSVGTLNSDAAASEKVAESSPTVAATTASTTTAELPVAVIITPTLAPAATTAPQVKASSDINVRSGPGTEYAVMASLVQSEAATIIGKNPGSDWWEVILANGQQGWVYGSLVETAGDTAAIAVALNIPTPPPTFTPAPTPVPLPTAEPAATTADPAAPTAAAPPADAATATPQAPAADPNGQPHFTLVSRRLWNKAENDGCIGKHLLRINVLDASGARINGVRLRGIYTGIEIVTGDQGKGDGIIEFDLHGSGEGFAVLKNNDGREASSDKAEGFTTRSRDIDTATLIATGYCSDEADCQIFYSSYGCQGHHSWEATFQRNY